MRRMPWLVLLFLCGCTTIDYRAGPVAGLETMTVEENYVSMTEVYEACFRCGHRGPDIAVACTCINFRTNHAVIWLVRGAPPWTVEHERAHGRGYDHTDGQLRSRYASWRARQGSRGGPGAIPGVAGPYGKGGLAAEPLQ